VSTGTYVSREEVIAGADPHWDKLGSGPHVHEWRIYVPEEVQALWHTFNEAQRAALYDWAHDLAMAEEWE
jgi:hypothetical protein